MITLFYKTLLGATATGAFVLTANLAAHANLSPQEEEILPSTIAVQFNLPDNATPRTSIGGGTRGGVQFELPENSRPNTSIGGGTRGEEIPRLTALVPPTKYGNTISGHPTIFAYLPPMGVQEIFFSLQDEEGNPFYHTTLTVSPDGGTIAITLPPEAPELEMGKNYLWYLAPLVPGAILRPDNSAVVGWIKRVESTINHRSLALSPVELAATYANAGIWYDTLAVLASAQRAEPENQTFAAEWSKLLQQVGLEAIASQPLADQL